MNDLYNMIFKTDPFKVKKTSILKQKNKNNDIKIIKKKLRIIDDKPEIININDVNPVTDTAPADLGAELERNIKNADLQNRVNEENINANPFQNIDRAVVLDHIEKLQKDHEYKQKLAVQVGEAYAKEDFYTDMLGLKDLQDELAKNAAEIHKLNMEIRKIET